MMRQCGDCQLCCKLMPIPPLEKAANERCRYQRVGKGCMVYNTRAMPMECKLWNCRWLVNDDTSELSRPDRSHYVIDLMPDFITVENDDTGEQQKLQVVVIWCDPNHPDAHRDPRLRDYLDRRGREGIAALVRYNSRDAFTIFPPSLAPDGQWHEMQGKSAGRDHTPEELHEFFEGGSVEIIP